jgi:hypothetical protein
VNHFESADSWADACARLTFTPLEPTDTAGFDLRALRIHVRDHKKRELAREDRTLEAHYGGFVFSQAWRGVDEARRLALSVSYGRAPQDARIGGHEARAYELGPEVPPDDIDGRSPAVVTWYDGPMSYLIASSDQPVNVLLRIAAALYAPGDVANQARHLIRLKFGAHVWNRWRSENPDVAIVLDGVDLNGMILTGANLSHASLRHASLHAANLRNADLRHADLTGATLAEADLIGARLEGAILSEANLREADLLGADLAGARYSAEDLAGALHVPGKRD